MMPDFPRVPLGKIGTPVCRIGLSATYRPGRQTVFKALDEGLNYFLYFGFDHHMTSVLRETVLAPVWTGREACPTLGPDDAGFSARAARQDRYACLPDGSFGHLPPRAPDGFQGAG